MVGWQAFVSLYLDISEFVRLEALMRRGGWPPTPALRHRRPFILRQQPWESQGHGARLPCGAAAPEEKPSPVSSTGRRQGWGGLRSGRFS